MKAGSALRAFAFCLMCLGAFSSEGADGDLDPDFDGDLGTGDGLISTDFFDNGDNSLDVAIQPDGKIVVAGSAFFSSDPFDSLDFAVARYLPEDGRLDPDFGTGGLARVDFGDPFKQIFRTDVAQAVAIQTDGKIVVAGNSRDDAGPGLTGQDFALARLNADGTVDASFQGGLVLTNIPAGCPNTEDQANDVEILPDGRILAAGFSTEPLGVECTFTSTNQAFALALYASDGTLDPTFGGGAPVRVSTIGADDLNTIEAAALGSDGKILAGGGSTQAALARFAVVRFNLDGSLDTGFGPAGNGLAEAPVFPGGLAAATSVVFQDDGTILVGGLADIDVTEENDFDFALVRYSEDGFVDTTFGNGGFVTTGFFIDFDFATDPDPYPGDFDAAFDIALQADGKIVLGGQTATSDFGEGFAGDFALARYLPDGGLDADFGDGGLVTTDLDDDSLDAIHGIAIQQDHKIIAVGLGPSSRIEGSDFELARYLVASSEIVVVKTAEPSSVQVGGQLTYRIAVTNNGPDDATDVSVTDELPAAVTFVSATPSQGTCDGTTTIVCELGALAVDTTAEVLIVVTVNQVGDVSNSASVTTTTVDPDPSNDDSISTITVSGIPVEPEVPPPPAPAACSTAPASGCNRGIQLPCP